jgi:hypothetical protein
VEGVPIKSSEANSSLVTILASPETRIQFCRYWPGRLLNFAQTGKLALGKS